MWHQVRRKGKPISLSEARTLALRLLSETEQEIHNGRLEEARLAALAWEDDGLTVQ